MLKKKKKIYLYSTYQTNVQSALQKTNTGHVTPLKTKYMEDNARYEIQMEKKWKSQVGKTD